MEEVRSDKWRREDRLCKRRIQAAFPCKGSTAEGTDRVANRAIDVREDERVRPLSSRRRVPPRNKQNWGEKTPTTPRAGTVDHQPVLSSSSTCQSLRCSH